MIAGKSWIRNWINEHPAVWEFILFNVLSNVATIVNFIAMWICTGFLFVSLENIPFQFFVFHYTQVESDLGLGGFLSFLVATAAAQAVERVGMPESQIILSQAAAYMACAPKSNAAYLGIDKALEVLDILTSYYEEKYKKIIFKLRPQWYDGQPFGKVEYYLLNHGYTGSQIALANVINIAGINTQEDVLKLFDSKRRNQVKKVIKEDLFHFSVGQDILSDVWANMNDKDLLHIRHTHLRKL